MKIKSLFTQLDLFSKPFLFFVGDRKEKNTLLGGLISLVIILVSIMYFYYLINLYFSNKVQPKITSYYQIKTDRYSMAIDPNQIMFQYFINGLPLKQYEENIGKTLLTIKLVYNQFFQDGQTIAFTIPLIKCLNEKFSNYLCIDAKELESRDLIIDPLQMYDTNYEISITPCDPLIELNCSSEEEIQNFVFLPSSMLHVFTKISQFNPATLNFEEQYKSEYIQLDPQLFLLSHFNLIRASTSVTSGILIQSTETKETILDQNRVDTYFSQQDIFTHMGVSGFGLIAFGINQESTIISVQLPMITEVLAQFSSIFNSLLTFGILARMVADMHIVQEINNILLKSYYKRTAAKLLIKGEAKSKFFLKKEIKKIQVENSKTKEIFCLQQKINEADFCQNKYFKKIGFSQRFKEFIIQLFSKKVFNQKKQSENNDNSIYSKLNKLSINCINIFELCRDLIKIKMAIKLILTKEQYSAIQFCGSEIMESNQLNKLQNQLDSKNKQKYAFQESEKVIYSSPFQNQSQEPHISQKQIKVTNQPHFLQFKNVEISLQENTKFLLSINPSSSSNNQSSKNIFDSPQINLNESEGQETSNQLPIVFGLPSTRLFTQSNAVKFSQKEGDQALDLRESQIENCFLEEQEKKVENQINPSKLKIIYESRNDQSPLEQANILNQQQCQQSHLEVMDQIDENPALQELYLQKFLDQFQKGGTSITQIDSQIFNSLLIHDQKVNHSLNK